MSNRTLIVIRGTNHIANMRMCLITFAGSKRDDIFINRWLALRHTPY